MLKRTLTFVLAAAIIAAPGLTAPGDAPAPETQLAGVVLGKPSITVIRSYGNPRQVHVGYVIGHGMQTPNTELPSGIEGPPAASAAGGVAALPAMPLGMGMGMGTEMMKPPFIPRTIHWIYEQDRQGVVLIFSFNEDGRVVAVTVGDGFTDSVARGGTRQVISDARTSRGIRLGSTFSDVMRAYGHPETQQEWGDEVVLTYFRKYGVAFCIKQKRMQVVSITIRGNRR